MIYYGDSIHNLDEMVQIYSTDYQLIGQCGDIEYIMETFRDIPYELFDERGMEFRKMLDEAVRNKQIPSYLLDFIACGFVTGIKILTRKDFYRWFLATCIAKTEWDPKTGIREFDCTAVSEITSSLDIARCSLSRSLRDILVVWLDMRGIKGIPIPKDWDLG